MQIDLRNETALSLTDATKAVPPIDNKRPHPSTVWRWCRKGLRGVRLEHIRVGHRVVTTREALCRFFDRLAGAEADTPPSSTTTPHAARTRTGSHGTRSASR